MSFDSNTFNSNVLFNNNSSLINSQNDDRYLYSERYQSKDDVYTFLSHRRRPTEGPDPGPADWDGGGSLLDLLERPGGEPPPLGEQGRDAFLFDPGLDCGDVPIDPTSDPPSTPFSSHYAQSTACLATPTFFPTPSTQTSSIISPDHSLTPTSFLSIEDCESTFLDFTPLGVDESSIAEPGVHAYTDSHVGTLISPYASSSKGPLEDSSPEVVFPTPQETPVPNFRTPCDGQLGNLDFELFAPLQECIAPPVRNDFDAQASAVQDADLVSFLDSIDPPRGFDYDHVSDAFGLLSSTNLHHDIGFDFDQTAPLFDDTFASQQPEVEDLPFFEDLNTLATLSPASVVVSSPVHEQQRPIPEPTVQIPLSSFLHLINAAQQQQSPLFAPAPASPSIGKSKKPKKTAAKKPYAKEEVTKTHACPGDCGKSFWRRDALRRHMEKSGCLGGDE